MQRRYVLVLVVVALVAIFSLYVWIVKPVLVLPAYTVTLPENNSLSLFERQIKANELTVHVRTNGKVVINADQQQLAYLSYDLASLTNATDLALKTAVPPEYKTGITIFQYLFPQLTWNAYMTGLSMYYALPVEITLRFVPG